MRYFDSHACCRAHDAGSLRDLQLHAVYCKVYHFSPIVCSSFTRWQLGRPLSFRSRIYRSVNICPLPGRLPASSCRIQMHRNSSCALLLPFTQLDPSARFLVLVGYRRDLHITGYYMVVTQIFIDIGCCYFPAAMARMTVAGPVTQSPPANTPWTSLTSLSLMAVMVPRFTEIPASSKWRVSIP